MHSSGAEGGVDEGRNSQERVMNESNQDEPQSVEELAAPVRKQPKVGWLEGLIGLAVLVSLAGVVAPVVGSATSRSDVAEAEARMLHIVEGLNAYSRDTLYLPTGDQGRTDVSWLYGPGVIPAENPFAAGGEARPLDEVLMVPAMGGRNWNGPYIDAVEADPWGNAFLVNVDGLIDSREEAMVLCAGPDGIVQTAPWDRRPAGDDLLMLLR